MENQNSDETKKFIDAEMAITRPYLDKSPFRAELQARYKELMNIPSYSGPFRAGNRYFSLRDDGTKNQPYVHYIPFIPIFHATYIFTGEIILLCGVCIVHAVCSTCKIP